jgi:hypothetical protein
MFLVTSMSALPAFRPAAHSAAAAHPAEAAAANTIGCVSDWYVSKSGSASFVLVHKDPDDLPLSALRFSRTYNDPTDLSRGYLDFKPRRPIGRL